MKTILLSGGTRGLGLSIAKLLAEKQYNVIATGRNCSEQFQSLVLSRNSTPNLFFEPLNLKTDDIHGFVSHITKSYGRLYGLINNAAIGKDGVLATMHESEIAEVIAVNLTSTILLTKYAVRSMLLNGSGRVINVSSIIANTGFNGLSVYAASKAGLIGFTKSLARELGKAKITVNAVLPGYMETEMTEGLKGEKLETIKRRSPLKTLISPNDVANMVLYLLSDDAERITGTTVTIDAGSTA